MKRFLGIFAILMMIGACGALFSDSEIDEEVAEEESVHEENEKETEQVEKVVANEESEVEDEVDGDNSVKSDDNGSDKGDKDEEDISDVEEEEGQEGGNLKEIEVEEESEEPEEEEVASSDMLPIYKDILVESFDGLAQVDYLEDSQMFTLLPLDPMFESELEAVVMGYAHDDFQYMVDSLQELSATGVGLIGEGYSIALVNPANIENYIVVVMDGIVIYNALDDL